MGAWELSKALDRALTEPEAEAVQHVQLIVLSLCIVALWVVILIAVDLSDTNDQRLARICVRLEQLGEVGLAQERGITRQ
jgi:hypothetical protein